MAKKLAVKHVKIACEGADTIELDKLIPLQGKLKSLSDEAYKRLRKSILDLGFSFPVDAWKDGNKVYILDAHQRVTALKKLRDEKYKIPKLPVNWVHAKNKEEAALKLLAAASQYGQITPRSLRDFMSDFKIDFPHLENSFQFPEIDFPSLKLAFFPDTKTVQFEAKEQYVGMPEYSHEDKTAYRSVIIHFYDQSGIDEFARLIKQPITDKTKMLWYPQIIIEKASDKKYEQK